LDTSFICWFMVIRALFCLLWTIHIAVEFDAAGDKWSGCNRTTEIQTFMETFFGHVHDICFIDEALLQKFLVLGLLSRSVRLSGFLNYRMPD